MNLHPVFGVIGRPVGHSRSPAMHRAWMERAGRDGSFLAVAARDAATARWLFEEVPFQGVNVTRPFKESLLDVARDLEPDAREVRAVNTLYRNGPGEAIRGGNTDPIGVERALDAHGPEWRGRRALVIGSGGAGRAAALALRRAGCPVRVLTRSWERFDWMKGPGVSVEPLSLLQARTAWAEIIVSTIPRKAWDRISAVSPRPGTIVLEADYGSGAPSPLDSAPGVIRASALEWLLHQGVEAALRLYGGPAPLEVGRRAIQEPPSIPRRVALVGFMGSGKSTVGPLVAKAMGAPFVDLDRAVEERLGLSVAEIFRGPGEEVFRRVEGGLLQELSNRESVVVSCGGGCPTRPENRAVLRRFFRTVWLFVTLRGVRGRLEGDRSRPLWRPDDPEGLRRLWEIRRDACARVADLIVDGEGQGPEDVAREIVHETGASVPD